MIKTNKQKPKTPLSIVAIKRNRAQKEHPQKNQTNIIQ